MVKAMEAVSDISIHMIGHFSPTHFYTESVESVVSCYITVITLPYVGDTVGIRH